MLLWPFNKYPGTDYETFNWEWILKTVKEWVATMQTFKNDITAAWNAMRAAWLEYKTSLTDDWQDYQGDMNDQWQDYQGDMNDQWQEFIDNTYQEQITEILKQHPEWVTTVMDGAISTLKLMNGAVTFEKLNDTVITWVTPEMFGAVGDGVTDDTDAFYEALEHDNVWLNAQYLIDFKEVNLYRKRISGNKTNAKIIQRNSNKAFGYVNYYTQISDVMFTAMNNTIITPVLVFGAWNNQFFRYDKHLISNIQFDCDDMTIPLYHHHNGNGSSGGCIEHINIRGCYDGLHVEMVNNPNAISWLTQQIWDDITVSHPEHAGIDEVIDPSRTQMSHSSMNNMRVQLDKAGTTAFKLDVNATIDYYNLISFLEGSEANDENTYSIDFGDHWPAAYWNNPCIFGGNLEGGFRNRLNGTVYYATGLNRVTRDRVTTVFKPIIDDLKYSWLRKKDSFVNDYDYSDYYVSSAVASVTKVVDKYGENILRITGGSSSGIVSKMITDAVNGNEGPVTVYIIYDSTDTADARISIDGAGTMSTYHADIPTPERPNRKISVVRGDINTNNTLGMGVNIHANTTVDLLECGCVRGRQTMAKVY